MRRGRGNEESLTGNLTHSTRQAIERLQDHYLLDTLNNDKRKKKKKKQ